MAIRSLSLGEHWEAFIRDEIESGRYSTASEVVRDALRVLEDRGKRLEPLRAQLAEGAVQAASEDFVEDFDVETVIEQASPR